MNYKNTYLFRIILLPLVFAFCNQVNSQTGWYQLQSGTSSILNSTYFVNSLTGYMVGSNIAIKTVNGGYTWQVMPNLSGGSSVCFVNALTGYSSNGSVFKTTDGGVSWTDLNVPYTKSLFFINPLTGYGAGYNNTIAKTTNGGGTWSQENPVITNHVLKSIFFSSPQNGYAVGLNTQSNSAIIYRTTNSGMNWVLNNLQAQNVEFRSVNFPVTDTGYIVGAQSDDNSGVIYKTFDAGTTWIQQGVTNRSLNSVFFVNSRVGYAVGKNGMVLKTVDGSVIWNSELSNTQQDINSVYFVAEDVGFTAGVSGTVQKTVNGGNLGPPFALSGFINYEGSGLPVASGKVYAVKYDFPTNSIIYVDTAQILNGVYTLTHVPQDSVDIMAYQDDEVDILPHLDFVPTFYGNTIFWANSNTLYPSGNLTNININVPKIINSGNNNDSIGGGVYAQNISSPLAGARVYAKIGNNYVSYGNSKPGGGYKIHQLLQGNYTLICDRFGYRSATRDITLGNVLLDTVNFYLSLFAPIGIINQNLYTPTAYKLEQNYPNPFNPSTNIRVDIVKDSKVNLTVYDMLGREVAVLINQQLKPGTYKVDWNAANYPSGIYFYKLVSNEFSQTKKMILIK